MRKIFPTILFLAGISSAGPIDSAAFADSLALEKVVAALPRIPCSIAGIPFGVSRQNFLRLAGRAAFAMLSDEGDFLWCSEAPFGGRKFSGAFYFDSLDRFCKYELEGAMHGVDSLDDAVRSDADHLGRQFQSMIGAPPHRTNRVGRHDIAEGELALVKAWSSPTWSVSVGLCRQEYKYYAKAVVERKKEASSQESAVSSQ
jgi:hypothetical protein